MKNTQKLAEMTDLQVVKNAEEVKGGTLFLLKGLLWGWKGGWGGSYGGGYGSYGGGHNSNCGH